MGEQSRNELIEYGSVVNVENLGGDEFDAILIRNAGNDKLQVVVRNHLDAGGAMIDWFDMHKEKAKRETWLFNGCEDRTYLLIDVI